MNMITSKYSFLMPPILFVLGMSILISIWAIVSPATITELFNMDGASPVELMTLPLFALIIPFAWLFPPTKEGKWQWAWSLDYSLLAFVAICRETDLHKTFGHYIWPHLSNVNFNFKAKFFMNEAVPIEAKLMVFVFYSVAIIAIIAPLVRYGLTLFKEFFRLHPVAWTVAFFGGCGVMSQLADDFEGKLEKFGIVCNDSASALFRVFEEGGEMLLAFFALTALLQAYVYRKQKAQEEQCSSKM